MDEIKKEFIKRYKYIYENTIYILAPSVIKTEKEIKIEELPIYLLQQLESFLLSDIKVEDSELYKELEENKKNPKFLEIVKNGVELLKIRQEQEGNFNPERLNCIRLLYDVKDYIINQQGKQKNKKLIALDEYFRLELYKNDGKIRDNIGFNIKYNKISNKNKTKSTLPSSNFVEYLIDFDNHYDYNMSILTEKEKQQIYLTYHNELPWDLEVLCEDDNTGLIRPRITKPCNNLVQVKVEDMFINPFNGKYYQLCPKCGYIININDKLLNDSIINKIILNQNKYTFRKNYITSELIFIEKYEEKRKKLIKK